MGCTLASATVRTVREDDHLREFDAYGSEDESPQRRNINPL